MSASMDNSVDVAVNSTENSEPNTAHIGSRKASKEVIFIGDNPPSGQQNLQASFMKFREQKIKEMQMMKMAKQASLTNNRTPEFKEALRKKFIDTAKKYIGVPYALRYKAPEDPVAPLYLDCCALVRQALLDLQDEFGFMIGRWNQCYQIDTLPIVLNQEELKPGDLIFYEGEYYSNRSKPQKHNMVHVEIFLGGESGEECIGSRYHRGKVSIFPSFKFTSTTWKLVNFHFRSIDTWLDGVCKSCCPDHPWQSDSLNYLEAAGKRSIFSDATLEDVDAGGDEEDEMDGSHTAICVPCITDDQAVDDSVTESTPFCEREGPENATRESLDGPKISSSPVSMKKSSTGSVKTKRPSPYRSGSSNDIENNTGNNKTSESTSNTVTKAGIAAGSVSSGGSSSAKIPGASGRISRNEAHHAYYVGKSNGWKLVKDSMDKRGWTQLPFDYQFSTRFGLKWVERRSQIDYRAHQPGQLVCHIPNNDVLCTKIGLLSVMRDYFQSSNAMQKSVLSSTESLDSIPWVPETYDLELPSDVHQLLRKEEQHQQHLSTIEDMETRDNLMNIWIYKPAAFNRGRGIRVVSGLESLRAICMGEELASVSTTSLPAGKAKSDGPSSGMTNPSNKVKGVIQQYIPNPLLVHGCKFDIRCYLLIARNFPTTYAFYHPGYCRLALKPYPTTKGELVTSLEDTMMHLTNASIQKKGADYAAMGSMQIQSIQQLIDHMEETQRPDNARYIAEQLNKDIMRCMVDLMRASNGKFLRQHGYFDLLGCDFMITSDNQLHLLEVNTNPAMSLDNAVLEDLLPRVIDGALELVLQTQGPDAIAAAGGDIHIAQIDIDKIMSENLPPTKADYQLIFDESKSWYYSA